MLAYKGDDVSWIEWQGEPRPLNGEGAWELPRNAGDTYSWQRLRTFGLYRVEQGELPAGKVVTARSLEDHNGRPREVLTLDDAPIVMEPYQVYRSTFISRMDFDPEAGIDEVGKLEAVLNGHGNAKLRQMFYAVEYFVSDDPLFAVLHWTVAMALSVDGEAPNIERADELLAPS
ncbi:hypothetical protein [Devosia aurantiaca]|uniref:Uncharacterized protein n=1 Tax=Devosia aurantiaca TaxID=2714858 RepID=A0A6M1T292_9HYPH|nr:hypothetical protein [Devosia aurantiaca]NGP18931.1 hypothetical protein [Devosia aurantiaca]